MDVVIFCGLQASGKSPYQRGTFQFTHAVVSKDLMGRSRKNKGGYQEYLIRQALEAGHSVVIDNTNPCVEDRLPYSGSCSNLLGSRNHLI